MESTKNISFKTKFGIFGAKLAYSVERIQIQGSVGPNTRQTIIFQKICSLDDEGTDNHMQRNPTHYKCFKMYYFIAKLLRRVGWIIICKIYRESPQFL